MNVENTVLSNALAIRLQSMNIAGLSILSHLEKITPTQDGDQLLAMIACLATFTDQREPWSSPAASEQAISFLNYIFETEGRRRPQKLKALLTDLLQLHVKPVFAKFQSSVITQQGRKAIDLTSRDAAPQEPEEETKPWKFKKAYIISVYGWVLNQLDVNAPPSTRYSL